MRRTKKQIDFDKKMEEQNIKASLKKFLHGFWVDTGGGTMMESYLDRAVDILYGEIGLEIRREK